MEEEIVFVLCKCKILILSEMNIDMILFSGQGKSSCTIKKTVHEKS